MTNREISAVLVGCGGISRAWLKALGEMPEVRFKAFVDVREEAARARAEEFGLAGLPTTTEVEDALDRYQPEVVFDCTVPESHYAVTMAALARGCHVLGEKPLADTVEHARAMVAAAAAAGRIYAVIQNRRYMPDIRRLRRFLASGAIGRVTTVNSDFYIGAHFGGFRDRMRHVLLVDMAIHTFDMARYIMGADARSVYCQEWNPPGSWYDHDASALAVFQMRDDIVYTYRGSWCSEGLNTSWEADWRIIGEKGSVLWDGGTGFRAQTVSKAGGFFSEWQDLDVPLAAPEDRVGGHAGVIREFLTCVGSGGVPETVASDNIRSLSMVLGAVESSESGTRVELDG